METRWEKSWGVEQHGPMLQYRILWLSSLLFTEVNECETGEDLCDPDAICINTIGSHNCTCKDGFEGDGFTCMSK